MEWIVSIEITSWGWGLIILTLISWFGAITLSKINNKHKSEQLDKVLKYKGSIQIEEGNQKDSLRINKLK
tara:strand:+ start:1675 stop:1884 length:210 start_codon:yes stop_codon:yes gene_type:complete